MNTKGINSFYLKIIAIITMVIDHAALVLVAPKVNDDTQLLYYLYKGMRIIGRVAFPIFCFFIVEGFLHTKNIKKYIIRLGVFALISEVPFDLAFFNTTFYPKYQNVMFTLIIGLATLCMLKIIEEKKSDKPNTKVALMLIVVLTACIIAVLLKTDYSYNGILAITLMYIFRELKPMQLMAGCISLLPTSIFVIIPFLLLALYNGERGKRMKYFFYTFYPLHIFLLYLISLKIM